MKKLILVLMVLLASAGFVVAEDAPAFTFSGSTGATAYSNPAMDVGNVDTDQDITIGFGPASLALNLGYTHPWLVGSIDSVTFGYTLTLSFPISPFTFGATVASNSLTQPVDGSKMTGDFLGDMTLTGKFAATKDFSVDAYTLLTAKKDYPNFLSFNLSATYAPSPISLTAGMTYMDASTVVDDVGYPLGVAAVEGLGFFAKAKLSY